MPDDTTGAATQADDAAEPQAGESTGTATSQADSDGAQAARSISVEEHRKVQREAQNLRKRVADAEAKIQAADNAKLSETERLQKQLKELQDEKASWLAERRDMVARDAVAAAAADEKVGARNPRAVYRLVKDDLQFGEDGQLVNLPEVLKRAKAEFPELFGAAVGSANGGSGARAKATGADMNAWLRGDRV